MSNQPGAVPTPTLAERIGLDVARQLARPPGAGLHIVATPIGNLGDITIRALTTLTLADVIYCEDTRHSRTLTAHFAITTPLRAYHEHNAEAERPRILARLADGGCIALISDAGTPLISDPGLKLVRDAIAAGHAVHAAPGPCAAIAALTVAGLATDAFMFAGFLPARSGQRQARLHELKGVPGTLVVYEAPSRVAGTLADMAATLGDRACVMARELTKLHEDVVRGTLVELAAELAGAELRGEVVLLVAPPTVAAVADDDIRRALSAARETSTTRDAIRNVAEQLAVPRSRVYNLATLMERDNQDR